MTAPRIMVVDDDTDLRQLICECLSRNGFEVSGAANSREMNTLPARDDYDCIILDLMMPEEDGLSILRRLNGPDPPAIIMLSAMRSDTDRIVGLELGADDYLAKPCNPRELLARVRAVLRRYAPPPIGPMRSFGKWTLGLVNRTKGADAPVFDRSIDVTVSLLRKQLGPNAPICPVCNVGYTFTLVPH